MIQGALERDVDLTHLFDFDCPTIDKLANQPPPRYIVDKLIPEQSVIVLYGASRSFKSFLMMKLAGAITRGDPYHNIVPCEQGAVLIVAAEGQAGMGKRARGLIKLNQCQNDQLLVMPRPFKLTENSSVEAFIANVKLLEMLHTIKFSVIMIDTVSKCSPGAKQNDHDAMSIIVDKLYEIQKTLKVTVIAVHHTNKGEDEFNGSYVFKSGVETVIKVSRDGAKSYQGKVTVEKQKDDEELIFDFEVAEIDITRTGDTCQQTTLVVSKIGENEIQGIVRTKPTDEQKNTETKEALDKFRAKANPKRNLAVKFMFDALGEDTKVPFLTALKASLSVEERNTAKNGITTYNKDRLRGWFPLDQVVAVGSVRITRYEEENALDPDQPEEFFDITEYVE